MGDGAKMVVDTLMAITLTQAFKVHAERTPELSKESHRGLCGLLFAHYPGDVGKMFDNVRAGEWFADGIEGYGLHALTIALNAASIHILNLQVGELCRRVALLEEQLVAARADAGDVDLG